tara:strand:+ start:3709 stop:3903 length:195 start_codon:yes stop_codon:yes gene_type:complete
MSARKIAVDPRQARKKELRGESSDSEWEAVWEAFTRLREQGLDLGEKASARIEKRLEVKRRIPK